MSKPLSWLPNALTLMRGAAGFAVAWAILQVDRGSPVQLALPFILFSLAALTDLIDGWLARKLDAVSAFGARIDPIADKILVGLSLIALAYIDRWHLQLLIPMVAIVGRDIIVTLVREIMGHPPTLAVMPMAKWKTAFELGGIALLLLGIAMSGLMGDFGKDGVGWWLSRGPALLGLILIWLAAILSVYTGALYLQAAFKRQQ